MVLLAEVRGLVMTEHLWVLVCGIPWSSIAKSGAVTIRLLKKAES